MHRIINLTNSPFDLIDAKGNAVRLPARGEVTIEPHPQHLPRYRSLGYFRIEGVSAVPKGNRASRRNGKP